MNCPHDGTPMIPTQARTTSGMGESPRKISVQYTCPHCQYQDKLGKDENKLSKEEKEVWKKR